MTQRATGRIELGPDDALPDVLLRVKATRGDETVLVIPETSNVLLTATEFRTLKVTADQVRVGITLETNDKLRAQLATMFGFSHAPHRSHEEQETVDEHPSWPTQDTRLTPSRVTVPVGDLTTTKPWRESAVDASSGISVPPKPVPKPEFALEPRTRSIASQEPEARAKTNPRSVAAILIGVLAALSIAAVLSIVLRTAEITVRTARQPVTMKMDVGYSMDGSQVPGMPIMLPARSAEFTVPYQSTVEATGTLDNQGGIASGSVELRNISGQSVQLPAGTRFAVADGTAYLTTAEVTIPRGDAENPGRAEVPIQAEQAGTVANREPGTLTGQVNDFPGIYFANIGVPIAGGTDVIIRVVTDKDLAKARDAAVSELQKQAAAFQLPDGRVVIPSTLQPLGDITVDMDHVAGDQTDTFTVSAQGQFQALTIDPADLSEDIQAEIRTQLGEKVSPGYALTGDPIKFSRPREAAPGSGAVTVEVSIDQAQLLNSERVDQIKQLTSGQSPEEARTSLAAMEGIEVLNISVTPSLLVKSLPGTGRIEVVAR